jgi:hypothetical protein
MKVLVVLPHASRVNEAARDWRAKADAAGDLTFLVCTGTGATDRSDCVVHTLSHEAAASRRWRRFFFVGFGHLPGFERIFWSLGLYLVLLRAVWPSLRFHIRSFDPDLVDLRWMPGSHALRGRLAEFPQIRTLAKGERPSAEPLDTSWRRYDPDVKVSIVLPVFNGMRYLRESIESCLGQSHRNLELIIVDDASTDGTPAMIAEYARKDPRVVAIRNAKNMRLPRSLNTGFSRATGDLLTWTSDDNNYATGGIEALVRYLCTWPDIDFVYSATRRIDEAGRILEKAAYRQPPWALIDSNVIGSFLLYRRKIYEELGGFRTDMEYVEDYEYWVRVYLRFAMMRLSLPLYDYRMHSESLTARVKHLELGGPFRERVRREHFGRDRERRNATRRAT